MNAKNLPASFLWGNRYQEERQPIRKAEPGGELVGIITTVATCPAWSVAQHHYEEAA